MLANIPNVNAPECESLAFADNIDSYRQYVGPANLAGKRIISSELAAECYSAFQQYIPDILFSIKRSFAAGVNAFVLHGFPYSGSYPKRTWPSFVTFNYVFSEQHSRHLPAWDFYNDWLGYVARTSYILQSGIPKIDVAFWLKTTDLSVPTQYVPTDLQTAG